MLHQIKHFCRYSETLALHYALLIVGVVWEVLTMVPDVANSVGLAQAVPPAYIGPYTIAIAVLTIVVRLRRFDEPPTLDHDHDHELDHDHA